MPESLRSLAEIRQKVWRRRPAHHRETGSVAGVGRELFEDLAAVRQGPLPEDEMAFMREFGERVHERAGWFMGG